MAEETRRPDPTLNALRHEQPVYFVTYHDDVPIAHDIDGCKESKGGPVGSLPAGFARWFAVPCRACFPDAPEPGEQHLWWGPPDPLLAWQLGETR